MAADNRAPSHMRTGLFYAIITYLMWGMLPLYFNLMADASPVEIVASRVVFSLIFCVPADWGELVYLRACHHHGAHD